MRLAERVYLVGSGDFGVSLTDAFDCHVYLLDGGSESALIDAGGGCNSRAILDCVEADGIPLDRIRYLILTHGHGDHAAGAAKLRDSLNLEVLAARDIADSLRQGDTGADGIALDQAKEAGLYPPDFAFPACPVDGELEGGDRIQVGDCDLQVVGTPGHALGHLSYLTEAGGKQVFFGGDAVFFGGRIALLNLPDCDLQAYVHTIERLSRLSVDLFLPGHECFSLANGQRHLDAAAEALKALVLPPNLL